MIRISISSPSAIPFLLIGAKTTLLIALFGIVFGFPFGIVVGLGRGSKNRVLRNICDTYCAIFRGTPMLVQIFVIYYGLAQVGFIGHNPVLWWLIGDGLNAAILAVVLNTGAYTAEIFRTGFPLPAQGSYRGGRSLRHVSLACLHAGEVSARIAPSTACLQQRGGHYEGIEPRIDYYRLGNHWIRQEVDERDLRDHGHLHHHRRPLSRHQRRCSTALKLLERRLSFVR